MLHIDVHPPEQFDNSKQEFVDTESDHLMLEHSLVSLSKWEQSFEKPFISTDNKTDEEVRAYIKFMVVGDEPSPVTLQNLSQKDVDAVSDYIKAKMTATWFPEEPGRPNGEVITSELIYYWMIALNIPFECQNWHLNTLLTLIQVCNRKNAPARKMSRAEAMARQREQNLKRRAQLGSTG